MEKNEKIKMFFKSRISDDLTRQDIISILQIEKAANVPNKALYNYLIGRPYYTLKGHEDKIINVIKQFGFIP